MKTAPGLMWKSLVEGWGLCTVGMTLDWSTVRLYKRVQIVTQICYNKRMRRKLKSVSRAPSKVTLPKSNENPLSNAKKLFDLTAAFPPGWWRIYEAFKLSDPQERLELARRAVAEYDEHKAEVRAKLTPPVDRHPWRWANEETGESTQYNPSVWIDLFKAALPSEVT